MLDRTWPAAGEKPAWRPRRQPSCDYLAEFAETTIDFDAAEVECLVRDTDLHEKYRLDLPKASGNLYLMSDGRLVIVDDKIALSNDPHTAPGDYPDMNSVFLAWEGKMQRRSVYRAVVLIALLGLLFTLGCSRLMPTPDPVTISFVYPEYGDVGQYEMLAQQFQEQYPYITVELHSTGDVPSELLFNFDTFVADHFAMPQYVQQQAILNLDAFIEQDEGLDMADFYPGIANALTMQGRYWGLPLGLNMSLMFYNKDVFDSFGAPYPRVDWDWGGFLDTALSVNDPFDDRYAYGLHYENEFAVYEPVIMMYQHGGGIFDSLDNPTQVILDTPVNIEAMDFYQALIYDHHIAPMPDELVRLGRPYPWRGVYEGRIAMWMMMYADRGGVTWPNPWDFNWGAVPMPRDVTNVTMATVTGMFVSAKSEHPEEAFMWIAFLSHQRPPLLMPARQSQVMSKEYENDVGFEVAEAARFALEDAVVINPSVMGMESGINAMWGAFEAIRQGEVTAEIALSTAQEQID